MFVWVFTEWSFCKADGKVDYMIQGERADGYSARVNAATFPYHRRGGRKITVYITLYYASSNFCWNFENKVQEGENKVKEGGEGKEVQQQ